jgi:hypothetical protein
MTASEVLADCSTPADARLVAQLLARAKKEADAHLRGPAPRMARGFTDSSRNTFRDSESATHEKKPCRA